MGLGGVVMINVVCEQCPNFAKSGIGINVGIHRCGITGGQESVQGKYSDVKCFLG